LPLPEDFSRARLPSIGSIGGYDASRLLVEARKK
jgi:hypothetical protein